ncbi:unnamed protein product [Laminaria digitata]
MRWTPEMLVLEGNFWATQIWGLPTAPPLKTSTIGKMGLKGVPGLNIDRTPQAPRGGGGRGGGRGGGGGRGRGRGGGAGQQSREGSSYAGGREEGGDSYSGGGGGGYRGGGGGRGRGRGPGVGRGAGGRGGKR